MILSLVLPFALAATAPAWTLEDCIRIAGERQPLVRAAESSEEIAGAQASQSLGSLGPQVGASGSVFRENSAVGTIASPSAPFTLYSAGIQGSMPLWDGARFYGWREARLTRDAAAQSTRSTRRDNRLDVATAYYSLDYGRRVAAVRRFIVEATEKVFANTRALVAAGRQPPIDAVRAEAQLESSRADLVQALLAVDESEHDLLTAMGVSADEPHGFAAPPSTAAVFSPDLTSYTKLVAEQDPSLKALQAQTRAARSGQQGALWGHLPNLTASGGYAWRARDAAAFSPNWNLGLTLNVPLFASGQTEGKAAERRYAARRASWLEESALQKANAASARLLGEIGSARKRLDSLRRARFAAEANRNFAEGRYTAGAGSIIEVIDAEILYASVLISEAAGERDLWISQAKARAAADLSLVEK